MIPARHHAIFASDDAKLIEQARLLAPSLGIAVHHAATVHALKSLIAGISPSMVVCDLSLDESKSDVDTLIALPRRYPNMTWIARISGKIGWAVAAELSLAYGFWEVFIASDCTSNLYEALREAAENDPQSGNSFKYGSTAQHAICAWQSLSQPDTPPNVDIPVQTSHQGMLSENRFLALFYRLFSKQCSGILHLRRPGLHWIVNINAGFPIDIELRDSDDFFGFECWYQHHEHEAHIDDRLPSARYRHYADDKLLNSARATRIFERRRTWISSVIEEIFTWPDAFYSWQVMPEKTLSPDETFFSEHDVFEIIKNGAFAKIPDAMILEVTHSCLSYFFKLKDNKDGLFCSQLPKQIKMVVDKLRKGCTLTEMLAILPQEYPVQRVVYLAAMTDEIDWLS